MEEASKRKDDLDSVYQQIELLDNWIGRLFWANVIFSILIFYIDRIPSYLQIYPKLGFILFVVLHFGISLYLRFHLIPKAENKRRLVMLSNAFGTNLSTEETNLYYNNEAKPSVKRLGLNTMENAFFGKHICEEMAVGARLRVLLYIALYILAVAFRGTDLDLILILTQTVFSGEVLLQWLNLERLRLRNEKIYDRLYEIFFHDINLNESSGIATVLNAFTEYEAAKAEAGIKQSSKIFFKLNPQLTKEWDKIRAKLLPDNS